MNADARLRATHLVHLGTAAVNDALGIIADMLCLSTRLDRITWTDSEIDEVVDELTQALRQERQR